MHSFIHSFIREREKARKVFGQSSWPLVAARANENKKETKRNAILFRRRRRGIIKETTKKRARVWSQRHKETHFFHLWDLREMTFPRNPTHRVQRRRNTVSKRVVFTFAFGTDEEELLVVVSEKPSSSFPSSSSSLKVVVIVEFICSGSIIV